MEHEKKDFNRIVNESIVGLRSQMKQLQIPTDPNHVLIENDKETITIYRSINTQMDPQELAKLNDIVNKIKDSYI